MNRAAFADLSLHEKNAYLTALVADYQAANQLPMEPLSHDAMGRLRRFYARRAWGDLKLQPDAIGGLQAALAGLADAIKNDDFERVLRSELMVEPTVRTPPDDDRQLDFFVPTIYDAPIKDDLNLMDVAPFSLSKAPRKEELRFVLNDTVITVRGGADEGIATAFDYDIFLAMVSWLNEAMKQYRIGERKGMRPHLPPKTFRPAGSEILKFCRRESGGRQYKALEAALDRLQATRIKIVNLSGGKRRETDAFSLIGKYRVVSRTDSQHIELVDIEIPDWVYEGVVHPEKNPSILTLHPDYFLIAKPLARFLYRLARKAAGASEAFYTVSDLHQRSGSKLAAGDFLKQVRSIVQSAEADPLPDYDFRLIPGKRGPILHITHRQFQPALPSPNAA